jgi:MoaF N-terminal domain
VRGKTLRYAFTEGPTTGKAYEHTFHDDGTVTWRALEAPDKTPAAAADQPGPNERATYGAFEVAEGIWIVSYRAPSGYTLTLGLNFNTSQIAGFASNEKEWHPVKGRLEE